MLGSAQIREINLKVEKRWVPSHTGKVGVEGFVEMLVREKQPEMVPFTYAKHFLSVDFYLDIIYKVLFFEFFAHVSIDSSNGYLRIEFFAQFIRKFDPQIESNVQLLHIIF